MLVARNTTNKCQEPCSSTSSHLLIFPNETSMPRLVEHLKHMFSVFKQHYTHFHKLFHPYVFQKNTNNITQIPLSNGPLGFKSSLPTIELSQITQPLTLRFFNGKHYVKIVFCVFRYLVTLEKMSQRKTISGQHKNIAYFYRLFSTNVSGKTTLSHSKLNKGSYKIVFQLI